MKTITIDVSEPVYDDFRRAAQTLGRPTSELIREAMEGYRRDRLRPQRDLRGFRPQSLGRVQQPLSGDDDLLTEMLDPCSAPTPASWSVWRCASILRTRPAGRCSNA